MKGQILKALRKHDGYLSGAMLSKQLRISRIAISRQIHSLRKDGYLIEASPVGYRLLSCPDLLLPCEFPELEQRIRYYPEIGSTMDPARELAKDGAEEGTIVVAEAQTSGRGRLSREWLSPRGGIYFTLILRPRISPSYAPRANLMASVAVAATITKLFGLKAKLKWPNDVLIGNRKVCGILAEMDAELDIVNFVNIGIGINVNTPVPQFKKTATSLKDELGKEIPRKEFLGALLAEIDERRSQLMQSELLQEYRRFSGTLDKNVRIVSLDQNVTGQAIDIDATGALVLKTKDGSLRTVLVGDCIHLS